jgi:hypothetical protein
MGGSVVSVYLTGTREVIIGLGSDQRAYAQTGTLLAHGIARLYLHYATCRGLAFRNGEQMLYIVLDDRQETVRAIDQPSWSAVPHRALARLLGRDTH